MKKKKKRKMDKFIDIGSLKHGKINDIAHTPISTNVCTGCFRMQFIYTNIK